MPKLAAINRTLGTLLGVALVVGIVLLSLGERRVDLWWQLPDGLSLLRTHHLPAEPLAAFGLPSRPFVDEYGLYEIGLGALYLLGGRTAIHVAFIAVYLGIFLIPLLAARGVRRDGPALGLLALAGIFMINRYEQRPEIVGVLLLAVLAGLLRRTRDFSPGFLLRIALLMAIWTNVHSSYVIGLAALLLWLLERTFLGGDSARWRIGPAILTLAVACGAVLVNPYGWHRVAFTFVEENDLGSNLLSREMWPAWDQPPDVQVLLLLTGALLLLVFARRPRPSRWLMALAAVLFVLTLLHIRHMSFLAVALLFLQAERPVREPASRWPTLRMLALGAACIAVLLFDFSAVRSAVGDLTASEDGLNRAFAPGLLTAANDSAMLCHDAEGSYAGFARAGLFPLLDSGQGRFDDDTKRFYFFAVQTPYAFDLALDQLQDVDDVLVTPPVEGWTLAMIGRPGWTLAASDPDGLLFRRVHAPIRPNRAPQSLVDRSQISRLAALRDQALRDDNIVWATCFSVLIDRPSESLALLDRSPASAWSEPFFSFARAWILSLPPDEPAGFLSAHPHPHNPLLRELLLARTPPGAPLPAPGTSALERLARVPTLLERGDQSDARTVFATIRRPMVSPLYYTLQDQLDPAAARHAIPSEQWQDWNAGGEALFERLSPQLDERARSRVHATGIR